MAWARSVKRWLGAKPRPAEVPPGLPAGDPAAMRSDADAILRAAIRACDPAAAVERALREDPGPLGEGSPVRVVGLGRAAAAMATGAVAALGDRVVAGMIAVPAGSLTAAPEPIRRFVGGHPFPDATSVVAGRAALDTIDAAEPGDAVLVLVSSGGFSTAVAPRQGLRVEDLAAVAELLHAAGAGPAERAAVRARLCELRAGGVATRRPGSATLALVLADEGGARPELVGGGPAAGDRSRFAEAQAALRRLGAWPQLPLAVRGLLERGLAGEIADTPRPDDPALRRSVTRAVGGPATAAEAARAEAERLGYEAQVLTDEIAGDPASAGSFFADLVRELAASRKAGGPRRCVVAAGGLAGRRGEGGAISPCHTMALAGAEVLDGVPGVLVVSVATSGSDGSAPAAGALVGGDTAARAREAGMDPDDVLRSGTADRLFSSLRDQIVTGPTGTAAGDLTWALLA